MNGLYSEEHGILTWESMRNYEKDNTLHFMVLYENDRTGNQKPGSPHARWLAATLGLSIMVSKEEERLVLENKWSLNTLGLLFHLICTAQLFPSFPLKPSMAFYWKPKQYTIKLFVLFFFFNFIYLFIYLFLAVLGLRFVRGLSLVAASGGHSSSRCAGLSPPRPLPLRGTGSRRAGSAAVAHGPSCSAACGTLPDQGSNPCPLH